MTSQFPVLEQLSISHLVAISQAIKQAKEVKPALDSIVNLVRTIFIFDNLVLYLYDGMNDSMDVSYARAIGRGSKAGADVSWGEAIATQVQKQRKTIVEETTPNPAHDRLQQPAILGIPLELHGIFFGALVYIRFGGPSFTPENIQLGEYIAWQISLLVQRQQIQEANLVLESRNKLLQFQDDFMSTISHELRTPLGFIKGYSTSLLRNDTEWDQQTQREFLHIIDNEADHLQHLIDNLLDSSRLQSGHMQMAFELVLLDHLLEDVITRSRLHYPDLQINLVVNTPITPIRGDPNRLTQVFDNLIANAAKYAPGKEVAVIIHQDENQLVIQTMDKGPGISPDDLPYVFNRFFRSSQQATAVRGTGLGLYICKQIIEAHHGQITVVSQPGVGTTFTVGLPRQHSQETV